MKFQLCSRTSTFIAAAVLVCLQASPASAVTIYSSGFEGTDGGWVGTGDWERGAPVAADEGCDTLPRPAPAGAASGSEVWATNLDGCYANSDSTSTLQQTFDLGGFVSAALSWDQWIEVFFSFDTAEVTANGVLLYERTVADATPDYESQLVDLTPFVGGEVTIEFNLFATTVVNRTGWYIDNVQITAESESIPAPGTVAVLGIGLTAFAFSRRRVTGGTRARQL